MKKISILLVLLSICFVSNLIAQDQIKPFWFVMLMKGPNRSQDSTTAAKIQAGHMNHMQVMANKGILKVAGPFGEEGDWRGIFILDCPTKEEAIEWLKKDPAIQAGRLAYEIKMWYTAPQGSFAPNTAKKE